MSEFVKQKIAFVIGALAVLFALTPILEHYSAVGFSLWGLSFTIHRLYVVLSVTLGLAAYSYGIQFMTVRLNRAAVLAGDIFYVVTIVLPPVYAMLFFIAKAADVASPLINSPQFRSIAQTVLSSIVGAAAMLFGLKLRERLQKAQIHAEARRRAHLELAALNQAERLFRAGQYDLAVIGAFRALETASTGLAGARTDRNGELARGWFETLLSVVPIELRSALQEARRIRNLAAHNVQPVDQQAARNAINSVSKVLAILTGDRAGRCPECGKTTMVKEAGSDHGFSWTRGRCTNCGYLDLD